MKPRIVREEATFNEPIFRENRRSSGPAYLALPWPTECPWTPEQVMAACEQVGGVPVRVPYRWGEWWAVDKAPPYRRAAWHTERAILTPEFMAEPKSPYCGRCSSCGVTECCSGKRCDHGKGCLYHEVYDRRVGERRSKKDRRTTAGPYSQSDRRNNDGRRRHGSDRRRSHD